MKKLIGLFLLFTLVCCSDNHKQELTIHDIKIQVFYKLNASDQELIPDEGAKVYIYYGKETHDFMNSSYDKDGLFIKENFTIIPDQQAFINHSGNLILTPLYIDRVFTIVIESRFYSPRLANSVFPSAKGPINQLTIFEP